MVTISEGAHNKQNVLDEAMMILTKDNELQACQKIAYDNHWELFNLSFNFQKDMELISYIATGKKCYCEVDTHSLILRAQGMEVTATNSPTEKNGS